MQGQMFCCPAHFGMLSEELRLALVATYDQRRAEERVGNPRRATREEWRTLTARAAEEWQAIRERLGAIAPGYPQTPRGTAWARLLRQLETGAEEVAGG
jgi:hypothetical protein